MRARVRALDGIKYIVNLIQTHGGPNGDVEILVNAIDCLAAYAEDGIAFLDVAFHVFSS